MTLYRYFKLSTTSSSFFLDQTGRQRLEIAAFSYGSFISTFEVVVVVLAVTILGETITLHKVLGACLAIGAVIILAKSEYRTPQARFANFIVAFQT